MIAGGGRSDIKRASAALVREDCNLKLTSNGDPTRVANRSVSELVTLHGDG